MKYEVNITAIGNMASTLLRNNSSLIILNQHAFPNLADMVIEHTAGSVGENIAVGDTLTIGINHYAITAIGSDATKNLRENGHCTIIFNKDIEMSGQIAVEGDAAPRLMLGDRLTIE